MKNEDKNESEKVQVSSFLILLGVLRGYINSPLWFLIRSKIAFKKFKKGIELDLPGDFIDSSGFIAWLYLRLIDKTGQEKAFEIIRAGILTSGLAIQQESFRNVEVPRTFENLIKYQQKTNKDGITRLNTMEIIEESDNKYEFRITRCMFYEIFTYLKVPELTQIICSIDNAIFNTYLPEKLTFHRNGINKTLAQGNDICEFVIENNE
jgi:L-2-amino-thiazoline-4-carboxylic acid hydrolase